MATKLFVGNVDFNATENDLQDHFSKAGTVLTANIVQDRMTGKARGFAFVEMSSEEEAQRAVSELNGSDFAGRKLTVNEARPKEERPRSSGVEEAVDRVAAVAVAGLCLDRIRMPRAKPASLCTLATPEASPYGGLGLPRQTLLPP